VRSFGTTSAKCSRATHQLAIVRQAPCLVAYKHMVPPSLEPSPLATRPSDTQQPPDDKSAATLCLHCGLLVLSANVS
jgi:hypothetical protein